MSQELSKKYGLFTAIAMVVGIVIGSGVFFKAEKILTATGGNLPLGILSWVFGGVIMISCACTFAVMATMGMSRALSMPIARMVRVASYPSISGMWMSIKIKS